MQKRNGLGRKVKTSRIPTRKGINASKTEGENRARTQKVYFRPGQHREKKREGVKEKIIAGRDSGGSEFC